MDKMHPGIFEYLTISQNFIRKWQGFYSLLVANMLEISKKKRSNTVLGKSP